MQKIEILKSKFSGHNSLDILDVLSSLKEEKLTFSTSLGYEDQVITHYISTKEINSTLFSLDTGRLFPETYSVLQTTLEKYKKSIQIYFPDTKSIENLITEKGPLSFYESVENRKECCTIRKVEPLKRALKGYTIWITGIRKEQSQDRENISQIEWDSHNEIIKVHPLLYWTFEEVKNYIKENKIPYNSLHDKGFISIGCQPCTRSVKEGEDFRAGRWWWEDATKKECGLHFK
jgi:phosphoadenosine phosphosulfate reductase